jgi:hypothetical protein
VQVQARQLKEVIDAVVAALEAGKSLTEHIAVKPAEKANNPFKETSFPSHLGRNR